MADATTPEQGPPPEETPPRRRFGVTRATARALLWLVVGLGLVALLLLRTALGNRVLLEWGLDRVEGAVAGSIEVGDIRSANLLRGARLVDIRLLTPAGDAFVVADSLEASYSLGALVRGDLGLSGVHLWGARVNFEKATPSDVSTLGRWIAPPDSESTDSGDPQDDEGSGFSGFTLLGARLTDATFRMRIPTELEPGGLVRVDTAGGRTLALDVEIEESRLPRVRFGGAGEPVEIEVGRADARIDILREPLFLDRLEAGVTVGDGQVAVEIGDLLMAEGRTRGTISVSLDPDSETLVDLVLDIADLDTRELDWISDAIPPLTGETRVVGQIRRDEGRWTADGADLDWQGADLRGGGTVVLADGLQRLQGVEVRTSGLAVDDVARWLPEPLDDVGGRIGGRVALDGAVSRMEVEGELTWTTPLAQPVVLRGGGAVTGLGSSALGFEDFSAIVGPFEWSELRRSAGLPVPIDGPGFVDLQLDGALDAGLGVTGEARHLGGTVDLAASRVLLDGVFRSRDGVLGMDLSADLSPLVMGIFTTLPDSGGTARPLPLEGTLTGSLRLEGDTERLRLTADVGDGVGDLQVESEFSPSAPTSAYSLTGRVNGISGALFPALGPDTRLTGDVAVTGGGATLAEAEATLSADFERSRVSGLDLDSLAVRARIAEGALAVDSLRGTVGGFAVNAVGDLALSDSVPAGTLRTRFETASLAGIRSAFLGDSILARPEEGLARRALEAEGIDPDTLPLPETVEWDGAVRGEATLTGSIGAFALEGSAVARDVRIGPNRVDSVTLVASGRDLPGEALRLDVDLAADSLLVVDRAYTHAEVAGTLGRREGSFALDVSRGEEERYIGQAGYTIDGATRRLTMESLDATFDSLTYELQRPATVQWGDSALAVEDVEVRRLGPDPVVIRVDGRLPEQGEVDFDLSAEGLDLELLAKVLQREDLDMEGRIDVVAQVGGRARSPTVEASLRAEALRWRRLEVASLDGSLDYSDRVAEIDLTADRDGDVVLDVEGEIPIDLALTPGTERFYDREMLVVARADDLPARATVVPLEDLERVDGLVSGELRIAGTLDEPRTTGSLRLEGGAWTVGSLGVRHTDVSGTAVLGADNVLDVDVSGRAGGTVTVDGTITLAPLTDPSFDLGFEFDEFLGVERRDIEGLFSGNARLTGTYRSPDIEGALSVDEGTIYLDEFVRNAQVVDLTNTRLSSLLGSDQNAARLLDIAGNPFMNGLRTEVDLSVENDTWLRGRDLEVEMVGDVTMVYNRRARDLALIGELTARRGNYTTLGRTFQVQEGTVGFIGTAGINPELDITATTRVRRQEFGDLTVTANVLGTLVEPRVEFSADEEAYGQSDIISYLLTGRPSTGITSSLAAGQSDAGTLALGTGASLFAGSIVSQIGAFAAQQTDVIDYLAITGVSDAAAGAVGGNATLGTTQVEVGRYFAGGDIFGALIFRAAEFRTQPVGGARVEWQSSDQFHIEAFFEDRFLRVASVGLADLGAGSAYVFGFALVREWGY